MRRRWGVVVGESVGVFERCGYGEKEEKAKCEEL